MFKRDKNVRVKSFPLCTCLHVQNRKSASQFCLNYLFDLPVSGPRRPAHTRGMWSHKPHFFLCQRCLFSLSFPCPVSATYYVSPLPGSCFMTSASVGLLDQEKGGRDKEPPLASAIACPTPAVYPGSPSIPFAETCQSIPPPCKKV